MRRPRAWASYLARTKGPADLAAIQREHVEGFIVHLLDNATDSTANNRYRGLQQFFKWALDEGEIQADPIARMKPPVITEKAIPILSDDTLKKLLRACAGREFTELRDTAIIRLLIDTGMRREEVATIYGRRPGPRHRQRVGHPQGPPTGHTEPVGQDLPEPGALPACPLPRAAGRRPELWLGGKHRGPLTADGIRQMLDRRCDQAGIPRIHPHQFRHTAADYAMKSGMSDNDVMRTFGWKSRQMLARYAAANADERAREAPSASAQETGYRRRISRPICSSSWLQLLPLLLGQVRLSADRAGRIC